ncbi:hypothetical protein BT93_A0450 [Corymbia citriodora subsp. variegata]|nr:hypothetical protein BT93_A0450 [Corymbia citriodora subsp. variegata]
MEHFAWPKNLSSSHKRAIQDLFLAQNPTKNLIGLFDAHSQTGNDTSQPSFVEHLVVNVIGSFSNTLSQSSSDQSNEVLQVRSNACVKSEDSEGSESINTPLPRKTSNIRTRLDWTRLDPNLINGGHQTSGQKLILDHKLSIWLRQSLMQAATAISEDRADVAWEILTRLSAMPPEPIFTYSEQKLIEFMLSALKSCVNPVDNPPPVAELFTEDLTISEDRADVAWEILTRLSAMPPEPIFTYSEQKLIEFMSSALKSRVNPVDNPPPVAELFTEDHLLSDLSLYDLSPCFDLGFLAANIAILKAASEQPSSEKLHVIDFGISCEVQYRGLLFELSKRQACNQSILKITTLADGFNGEERLRMVGDRLSELAAWMGVGLVFNVVSQKLSELSRDLLGCKADEVLAVNLAFKLYRMPDESVCLENPRDELLRRVKGLAPRVVTLVEQEMNGNTAPFKVRVGGAMAYYGALLQSIQFGYGMVESEVVEGVSRKLRNTVACEGRERVERCEVFGKWRARMEMAGFELKPLGQHVAQSFKARLATSNPGYTVKEENGGVCFGWRGRTLTVASAWR